MNTNWKSAALGAILSVAAIGMPSPAAGGSADSMLQCGKDCLKSGDYSKAVVDLQQVVAKQPNSCEGHFLLGQAYCHIKNYVKARDQLRAAIRTGRGSVNAQKANALLMTLPKQFLSPKTGDQARLLASMLGLTRTRGGSSRPTVIDFYAPWCVPCKQLNTVLDKQKQEYGDKINFMTINVDDPANDKLIDQYEVSPIPTVVFLSPTGDVVSFVIGYQGQDALDSNIKKILASGS